ncbi:DNA gyrase subunit B [Opitutaceae bacterium TAV5]|nr:DNA gyrase subunit B [Opitutaceae bacterium TAV5]
MRRPLDILTALALILYPVAVYAGLNAWGVGTLAPLLLAMFVLRLLRSRPKAPVFFPVAALLALAGGLLALLSWTLKQSGWLLWYPVAASLVLLGLFGWTLLRPPSFAERVARLADPVLPPAAVVYTRNVTRIWCVFFFVNALVALGTCLSGDLRLWTLYNGAISYALVGLLAGCEWLVRRKLRRRLRMAAPSVAA